MTEESDGKDNVDSINSQSNNNEDSKENVITDVYIDAAKHLIASITNPVDKETCLVWVDFIRANKNEQPVLLDYLMLLLLSLHQEVRSVPFDEVPPPIDQFNDIEVDLFQMGQRIIEANRAYKDKRAQFNRQGQEASEAEGIPLFEWSTGDHDTKDYFVSQVVPGFGRQSYFTTTSKEQPFWFPNENVSDSGSGDYLSRIAAYMHWLQGKDTSMFDESARVQESITKRNWWKDFQNMRDIEYKSNLQGFKWHPTSILENVKTKLDSKAIGEFFQKTDKKGLAVLSIDERTDAGLHDRTFTDADKLSYARQYKNIFTKRSHGVINTSKTASEEMEELLNEKGYNKSWSSGYEADKSASQQSGSFKRSVTEHTLRKLLRANSQQTSANRTYTMENVQPSFTARSSPDISDLSGYLGSGMYCNLDDCSGLYSEDSIGHGNIPCERPDTSCESPRAYEERMRCGPLNETYPLGDGPDRTYTVNNTQPSCATYTVDDLTNRTYSMENVQPSFNARSSPDTTDLSGFLGSGMYCNLDDCSGLHTGDSIEHGSIPCERPDTSCESPRAYEERMRCGPLNETYTQGDGLNRTYTIDDTEPSCPTYTVGDGSNRTYTMEDIQPAYATYTDTYSPNTTDHSGFLGSGRYSNLQDHSALYSGNSYGYGKIPSEISDFSCESSEISEEGMPEIIPTDQAYCRNYNVGSYTNRPYTTDRPQSPPTRSSLRGSPCERNTSRCEKTVRFSCDNEQSPSN